MSTNPRRLAAVRSFPVRALTRLRTLSPETGDALLYGLSAAFALVTICTSTLALYRQWAELAIGPFIFGTVASVILAVVAARRSRHRGAADAASTAGSRRNWVIRIAIAVCVFVGATAIPLGLEIVWRSDGDPGLPLPARGRCHRARRATLAKGQYPYYEVTNSKGKVVHPIPGQSVVNSFVPYLPLMTLFGIPSEKKHDVVLTDARIFFSLVTLLVAGAALFLCPGRRSPENARPAGDRHLAHCRPPVGHGRRRHAGGGLPSAGHGAGAAPTTVRFRRRTGHRLRHEVHRMAPGRIGTFRGAQSTGGPASPHHVPRHAGRGRTGGGAVRAARSVGVLRQRRPLPVGALRRQLAGRQPLAGPPHRDGVPVPPSCAPVGRGVGRRRRCWRCTSTGGPRRPRPRCATSGAW